MCVYLVYYFLFTITIPLSSWYILYTYDLFNIQLTSLWLDHVYTEKQQNIHVLSFSFCLFVAKDTNLQHCGLKFFSHLNIPTPIK